MLQSYQDILNKGLQDYQLPNHPRNLYEPVRYLLNLGGKRIRPVLVLMAADLFGGEPEKALHAALAIEVFHNFTLIHDDIMDQAPIRRGQPTVHEKWDTNTAILSGDVMMVEANKHLTKTEVTYLKKVLDVFNETAQGVCEGQLLDMEFEKRHDVSIAEYIGMIRLKTAILLGGALQIGAIIGGAADADARLIYDFGVNLGLAFQLQDDILDVYGDPEKFGKQIGGDILSDKKTFLLLTAFQQANEAQRKQLADLVGSQHPGKVAAVTALYDELNVRAFAEAEMDTFSEQAFDALKSISVNDFRKAALLDLAENILAREK
ncbi:isoprenyl synthetase [Pedobacter yulinensis]|uniref:Isoprenyl synthetase n=1 Tax=Pedobacter yulinensis TaxID=2126353 RepID=A0A2T3HJ67_9SPHI|nr:polyprenyl synthetase family protein [Pedobacter yulinensis]PST82496.1 isoprenyl synthetase [Pedobacter yulinensis]